ncbi:peptidoglycan-N-acetylglucosamine deacetylase [Clostridium acetireducens DSM 10703]|jgi:peptidoglycan/xylan/chitin deacetylase (PgdA/CDA1 family)|uniref:Peptidoglycan-N-acetylglucosamine deacetylase n=1 Tax=Clostridium acetireducens DSM 10703 TaxID=1121290 RepID=A0A1E8EY26_9CLOT|nr:polysaccharide deacetylase family protein [Clostridium acetireducens]OFI05833.1 peptidoglycan-N-acetylglucosamine deacetylase [Clostridium acetireducens DSM 10703]
MNFNKSKKIIILFLLCISLFSILLFKNVNLNNNIKVVNTSEDKTKKEVYLTFDDGPIPVITDEILDVLKENNIKATFFVVGKEIEGREEILKRICKEGHGIGLHTYTHDLKKIYSNNDNFINEMIETQNKVKEITGYNSNIIRFPGGSAGRLNENMLESLHNQKFKVYDWNVDLKDGMYPNLSPRKLLENAKKCRKDCTRVIILAHTNSNNQNTIIALKPIIDYYKNLGYEFKTISKNTREYYYKI